MATQKEIGKYCRDKKFYEKANVSLCAFSNFNIYIDGNTEALEKTAKAEGLEFFILKGELKKSTSKIKEETI